MEHKITTEKILQASKSCDTVKKTLEILFPEVFENEKPFCKINDVLIRKHINVFYTVRELGSQIVLVNISSNYTWSNKIKAPYPEGCGEVDKILSRQDFRNLVLGQVKTLDDFKVLDTAEVQKLYFNS